MYLNRQVGGVIIPAGAGSVDSRFFALVPSSTASSPNFPHLFWTDARNRPRETDGQRVHTCDQGGAFSYPVEAVYLGTSK